MAGIGFRLRELAKEETPWASLQIYVSSALISCGPWIITIVNLFLISIRNPAAIDDVDRATLFCIITYAMLFSFLWVGIFSLAFIRYLADQIYLEKHDKLLPALNGFLVFILPVTVISGFVFLEPLPLATFVKFCAMMLYLSFTVLWIVMIYLSALRDYVAIVWAFFIGAVCGWGLLWGGGEWGGIASRLLGFTFGQLVTVGILSYRIFKELSSETGISFEFIGEMFKRPLLLGIGLFYNLGLWIDKCMFWGSSYGTTLSGFAICPFYDTSLFYAQLSLIPTMTMFLVHIETNFYDKYRTFYREAVQKQPLYVIEGAKRAIHQALREGVELILKYQGVVSAFLLISVEWMAPILNLDPAQIPLVRVALLGAFVHSLVHIFLILILYFDFQRQAFWMSFSFVGAIGILTALTIHFGLPWFGFGYLGGCLIALVVGYLAMDSSVKDLEFHTFAKQPVASAAD